MNLYSAARIVLRDPALFSLTGGVRLRSYQTAVARAIVDSVLGGWGLSFVVLFPRQSGKNELQAQIEAYLLSLLRGTDAEIIKISPTLRPQSQNAMRRLQRVLEANPFTRGQWRKESGAIYRLGRARIYFLSGAPGANIVGATASTLLEVDEAQDVRISKFDKDIAPMAASTNATRVFWGTAWTSRTLLARELRAARTAEARDGRRRVFAITAEEVAAEVPAYAAFVAGQVARLGRSHPMVRTQFFSEEIDAGGGMFPADRIAHMRGAARPAGSECYALLVDVAGEDEVAAGAAAGVSGGELDGANPRRDATALTVVAVDASTRVDPQRRAPTYRAALRRQWIGVKHTQLFGEIQSLAEQFSARWVVVDATGVGAGLASFLSRALPGRVLPFIFSQVSKSKLGWDFLNIVDGGRWQEPETGDALQAEFFRQLSFCQYEILPGPGKRMKWGVPDGTRDPASGAWVHDDLVMSAALCSVLEEQEWGISQPEIVIRAKDPLDEMRGF